MKARVRVQVSESERESWFIFGSIFHRRILISFPFFLLFVLVFKLQINLIALVYVFIPNQIISSLNSMCFYFSFVRKSGIVANDNNKSFEFKHNISMFEKGTQEKKSPEAKSQYALYYKIQSKKVF